MQNLKSLHCSCVVVLGAGDGSRMNSSVPKVFHKVGGLSLIDHVILSAADFGDDVIVVVKPEYDVSKIKFANKAFVAHQKTPKGTADAVMCGLSSFAKQGTRRLVKFDEEDDWTIILYGDIPLISKETICGLLYTGRKSDDTAVVILAMNSDGMSGLGKLMCASEPGTIKSIVEARDAGSVTDPMLPLCNAGIAVKTSVLHQLLPEIKPSSVTGELYITDIVRLAHESGFACRYFQADVSQLCGVNTRSDLAQLEYYFQSSKRKQHMENGVTLVDPESVFFSYDTIIDKDVTVYQNVVFLEGVKVESGAVIKPFSVLEGVHVHCCEVGPFSRIRPGSVIHDGAKIGNFVEIKNSQVLSDSKVCHLSYIGDSKIGSKTNIGAGTITCNYDGFKKHRTEIGDCVFVGSNTAIVAPVEIASNSVIAAGSVITSNVSEGDLAISRSKQKNIENWTERRLKEKKKCVE